MAFGGRWGLDVRSTTLPERERAAFQGGLRIRLSRRAEDCASEDFGVGAWDGPGPGRGMGLGVGWTGAWDGQGRGMGRGVGWAG
eukprot:7071839-Prymnesium_polylepis.1